MFKHLRVKKNGILETSELTSLGRINVICGKNNSGKTTLLESIHSADREIGHTITDEDLDMLKQHGPIWGATEGYRREKTEYLECLRQSAAQKEIWFKKDQEKFITTVIDKEVVKSMIRLHNFFTPSLANVYPSLFENYQTIFIPPKRSLECLRLIDTEAVVESTGAGILNYLFYAKNQNDTSKEKTIYNQIVEAFTKISSGYFLNIETEKPNRLSLKFSLDQKKWIIAQDSGLGLHELIIIIFFAINSDPKYDVVLIEEPENHLHPEMQRKLLYFLSELTNKQFFITTHSNIFLNNALVDRVFLTSCKKGMITVDDASSKAVMLEELGYSVADNLISDLVILVEGPHDRPVVEGFLLKMGLYTDYDIKIWPLGGDIMGQSDLSVFAQNYSVIGLIDKDPGSKKVRDNFIENCETNKIEVFQLKRYAIENYFSLRALKEVYGAQIPETLTELKNGEKLEKQIGFDVKKKNSNITKEMKLEEIDGTDLFDFFERVRKKCTEAIK